MFAGWWLSSVLPQLARKSAEDVAALIRLAGQGTSTGTWHATASHRTAESFAVPS